MLIYIVEQNKNLIPIYKNRIKEFLLRAEDIKKEFINRPKLDRDKAPKGPGEPP
jgi:hypothetical protein